MPPSVLLAVLPLSQVLLDMKWLVQNDQEAAQTEEFAKGKPSTSDESLTSGDGKTPERPAAAPPVVNPP